MSARSSPCHRRSTMRRKAEFSAWGPGKYDPRHHAFDGTNIIPLNGPSRPIVIPPIYGLKGVGFETFTGDGPIWYWNSYVGVGQMGGHGSFSDPRIGLSITQTPDLVTPKLAALLDYQLSLRAPEPPQGSVDRQARRSAASSCSKGQARCATATSRRTSPTSERPRSSSVAARSGRSRDGSGVMRSDPRPAIPHDTVARPVAARAVFSRRQRSQIFSAVVDHYDQLFRAESERQPEGRQILPIP